MDTAKWVEVSRSNPCRICGKPNWCSVTTDDVWAMCRRVDAGDNRHKIDRGGSDYWIYRLDGKAFDEGLGDGARAEDRLPEIVRAEKVKVAGPDMLDKVYRALLKEYSLSAEHVENLKKRGLPEEEIRRRGYRSMQLRGRSKVAKELAAEFGPEVVGAVPGIYRVRGEGGKVYWTLAGAPGILVPMRDSAGRITALKIRVDKPGNGPKYPYMTSRERKDAVDDGPGPEPCVHFPVKAEGPQDKQGKYEVVRLTEGELKADVATILSGVYTISLPGVSAWRTALPVIKEMAPQRIRLAFDADCRQNYNVARALQNTAVALQAEGFAVELETWPEEYGKGIDDVLAAGYVPVVVSERERVTAAVNEIAATALAEQKMREEREVKRRRDERRPVNADYQDLVYQMNACWGALGELDPPKVFNRSGLLVQIKKVDEKDYLIDVLRNDALRNIVANITRWYKTNKDGREYSVFPVMDTVRGMLSDAAPPVPRLRRIVQAPVFAENGTLITEPGYHEEARTWHEKTCEIPEIPKKPAKEDVLRAKSLFFDDLFVDFPFTCESDKAYAVAATLLPFCRQMIDGPTPLHLIDARSGAGTGKSLLADMITIPAVGKPIAGMTEARDDDEWRKRITAKLMTGPTFFYVDNINRKLDSGGLSAAITLSNWEDRMLGESRSITVPIDCVWLATGNAVKTSREIARRLVKTKLDARIENPMTRTGFKHANLREWAMEHRGDLIWAALTMIRAWVAAGQPQGGKVLGSFEHWSRVMGGILDVAEIPGFLTNLREIHGETDEETEAWHEFLNKWWLTHKGSMVSTGVLYTMAVNNDLLLPILGGGSERSQKTALGRGLSRLSGRRIGGFEIVEAPPDRRMATKNYRLGLIEGGKNGASGNGSASAGYEDDGLGDMGFSEDALEEALY